MLFNSSNTDFSAAELNKSFQTCSEKANTVDLHKVLESLPYYLTTQQKGELITEATDFIRTKTAGKISFLKNELKPHILMLGHKGAKIHKFSEDRYNEFSKEKRSEVLFIGSAKNGFIEQSSTIEAVLNQGKAEKERPSEDEINAFMPLEHAVQESLRLHAYQNQNGIYSDVYYSANEYKNLCEQATRRGYKNRTNIFFRPLRTIAPTAEKLKQAHVDSYLNIAEALPAALLKALNDKEDFQLIYSADKQSPYQLLYKIDDGEPVTVTGNGEIRKMIQHVHNDINFLLSTDLDAPQAIEIRDIFQEALTVLARSREEQGIDCTYLLELWDQHHAGINDEPAQPNTTAPE